MLVRVVPVMVRSDDRTLHEVHAPPREQELSQRIRERPALPFSVWDGKVRLSIPGYQDKVALFVRGEEWFLAEGTLASTHILKPEPVEK